MRFPLGGLLLLALIVPAAASPPTLRLKYQPGVPFVEKLSDLSCRVESHRLEVLGNSLILGRFRAQEERQETFFSGTYRVTIWTRLTGESVSVLHRPDGTVCVWEFNLRPQPTTRAEAKSPP
jgi:hypothetical protein